MNRRKISIANKSTGMSLPEKSGQHLPHNVSVILLSVLFALVAGCSIGYQSNSPEVRYSAQSSKAQALQVPPDLIGVGRTEQLIVPGTVGGQVTPNTLLPVFDGMKFERSGRQSWLAIDATAEEVWPKLTSFLAKEQLVIAKTQPTTGLIATEWQAMGAAPAGSALRNLIGKKDAKFQRISLRLERDGTASRVFARSQQSDKKMADDAENPLLWPASSHNPEQTSGLLQKLLVFLGVDEQKAKGMLDASASANTNN